MYCLECMDILRVQMNNDFEINHGYWKINL